MTDLEEIYNSLQPYQIELIMGYKDTSPFGKIMTNLSTIRISGEYYYCHIAGDNLTFYNEYKPTSLKIKLSELKSFDREKKINSIFAE